MMDPKDIKVGMQVRVLVPASFGTNPFVVRGMSDGLHDRQRLALRDVRVLRRGAVHQADEAVDVHLPRQRALELRAVLVERGGQRGALFRGKLVKRRLAVSF